MINFTKYGQEINDPNKAETQDIDDFDGQKYLSEIPHWMHLSFVNYDHVYTSQNIPYISKYTSKLQCH